ncbi:MAG: hypothetical protein M3Q19_16405 [Pseudomonadota bacterium]|nr:hypothetical protein [Pseudomonadota bacterium]
MRTNLIAGALLLGAAAPASAMNVATFLMKAEAVNKKGPLALFSGDLKLLTNQVKADAAAIRAERLAAEAARKRPNHCPPAGGVKLSDKDVLAAMEAVPPTLRAQTNTKNALSAYLARRFPCAR